MLRLTELTFGMWMIHVFKGKNVQTFSLIHIPRGTRNGKSIIVLIVDFVNTVAFRFGLIDQPDVR